MVVVDIGALLFLTWLLLGLVFSFVCLYVARKRGRNPATWFIMGLLLGPFAYVLIHYTGRDKRRPPARAENTDPDRR